MACLRVQWGTFCALRFLRFLRFLLVFCVFCSFSAFSAFSAFAARFLRFLRVRAWILVFWHRAVRVAEFWRLIPGPLAIKVCAGGVVVPEDEIQIAVVALLQHESAVREQRGLGRLRFSHPAQSTKLSLRQQGKLKRLGVRRGLLDIFLVDLARPGAGVLELKADGGSLQPEQWDFLYGFASHGVPTCIAYSVAEAEAWLRAQGFLRWT